MTSLTFGENFNQPIELLDLKSVTSLTFGENFNQPIQSLDLKSVTSLTYTVNRSMSFNDIYAQLTKNPYRLNHIIFKYDEITIRFTTISKYSPYTYPHIYHNIRKIMNGR